MAYDPDTGEAFDARFRAFGKNNPKEYKRWEKRIIDNDVNQIGYAVRQDEDSPSKWNLFSPKNQKIGEYKRRQIWRRMGRFPRSRVLRLEISAPNKATIIKVEADIA